MALSTPQLALVFLKGIAPMHVYSQRCMCYFLYIVFLYPRLYVLFIYVYIYKQQINYYFGNAFLIVAV